MSVASWIARDEATALLNVRPQTLYAYVSRGMIAARPEPADPRRSLYARADVEKLVARRSRRSADVAENAISWGEAVLPTSISSVSGGRLFYRGVDVATLAMHATLEEVAARLWGVEALPAVRAAPPVGGRRPSIEAAMVMLAHAAAASTPTRGRATSTLIEEGAVLLRSVALALGAKLSVRGTISEGFGRRWRCDEHGADAIRVALVLLADHELNASAFAARVAASTGAPLAAAALAGFAALLGPAHGAATRRVGALVADARRVGAKRAIDAWLRTGEALPGFGHRLYSDIDPRAAMLLRVARPRRGIADLIARGRTASGLEPSVDFALVVLCDTLGLPEDAPFILFAAARTAGWLAHAMEQAWSGKLIRPRARYVGPQPASAARG